MASAGSAQTTCPLCHTACALMSGGARETPENWRCVTCGQRWDARRLATVAAYASWALEHEKAVRAPAPPWDDGGAHGAQVRTGGDRTAAV
jgi:hypothetical protein